MRSKRFLLNFVPASSKSVVIAIASVDGHPISGGASTTTDLTNCSKGCTVYGPGAPAGSDTFSLTIFSGSGGKGSALATGTCTITVVTGVANSSKVTMQGIPATFRFGGFPSSISGTPFSSPKPLALTVKDAAGDAITGTYSDPVDVTDSDTSSLTTGTALSVKAGSLSRAVAVDASTDALRFNYGGAALSSVMITASASRATSANAPFTPGRAAYSTQVTIGTQQVVVPFSNVGGFTGSVTIPRVFSGSAKFNLTISAVPPSFHGAVRQHGRKPPRDVKPHDAGTNANVFSPLLYVSLAAVDAAQLINQLGFSVTLPNYVDAEPWLVVYDPNQPTTTTFATGPGTESDAGVVSFPVQGTSQSFLLGETYVTSIYALPPSTTGALATWAPKASFSYSASDLSFLQTSGQLYVSCTAGGNWPGCGPWLMDYDQANPAANQLVANNAAGAFPIAAASGSIFSQGDAYGFELFGFPGSDVGSPPPSPPPLQQHAFDAGCFLLSGCTTSNLTEGPDGDLWFIAYENVGPAQTAGYSIYQFSGGIERQIETKEASQSGLQITDLVPDSKRDLMWFVDSYGSVVRLGNINPTTAAVSEVTCGSNFPSSGAMVIGNDGNLYVAGNKQIQEFDTSCALLNTFTTIGYVNDMIVGPDLAIWGTENNGISRLANGTVTQYSVGQTGGPIVGSDGNIWFTGSGATIPTIGEITTTGTSTLYPLFPGAPTYGNGLVAVPGGSMWIATTSGDTIATDSGGNIVYSLPISLTPPLVVGSDGNIWSLTNAGVLDAITPPASSAVRRSGKRTAEQHRWRAPSRSF